MKAASGDEPGAAIFMSVFFVELCFVAVGAEQDVRHPFRGSAHLFADGFQINTGIAFDDQFIMDMPDDKALPEGLHGIAENVPADSLHDVFYELGTIGFDAIPLLCRSNTFVGDGFATELVLTDARLHVGEQAI